MPPPNMPFQHKDFFELKAIEKKQTEDELSALPPPAYKQTSNSLVKVLPAPRQTVPGRGY